jgi:hypothetical protein
MALVIGALRAPRRRPYALSRATRAFHGVRA